MACGSTYLCSFRYALAEYLDFDVTERRVELHQSINVSNLEGALLTVTDMAATALAHDSAIVVIMGWEQNV